MTIRIENQPIVFYDNCTVESCECGNPKCDKYGLMDGRFAFQFTDYNNQYSAGNVPDIDIVNLCDDSVIDQVDSGDMFLTSESVVSVNGLWSDYLSADGCYYFEIHDVEIALNGTWATNLDNWTAVVGGDATLASATPGAALSGNAGVGSLDLYQTYDSICTRNAQIQFKAATTANINVLLYVNSDLVMSVNINNELEPIIYNVPDGTVVTQARITCLVGAGEVITFYEYSFTNDYYTNPICVHTTPDFCYVDIEAYSIADHSDFEFATSGFKFYLLLKGAIANPRYPTEEELYLSSAGQNTLQYARSEKHYDLQIERCTESTWDALTSIMMCDYIYINGTRYVKVEGDIEPKWNRSNKFLAGGTLTIKKHTENRTK